MKKYGVLNKENNVTEYTYCYHRQKSLGAPWSDSKYVQYEITEGTESYQYLWDVDNIIHDANIPDPNAPTTYQLDYIKYRKRALARDDILATMASNNMERVRQGVWTEEQLVSLTQDAELKMVLDDVSALAYDLAQSKVLNLANPLMTEDIKNEYLALLAKYTYNE